jgi:hypothetical protein
VPPHIVHCPVCGNARVDSMSAVDSPCSAAHAAIWNAQNRKDPVPPNFGPGSTPKSGKVKGPGPAPKGKDGCLDGCLSLTMMATALAAVVTTVLRKQRK